MDPPYRCARTVVVRFWPWRKGAAIGWWVRSTSETREDVEHAMGMVDHGEARAAERIARLIRPDMVTDAARHWDVLEFVWDTVNLDDEEFEVALMKKPPV
jgi:hypothetical protein